jgi:Invasion associated locus B (IalB) protein
MRLTIAVAVITSALVVGPAWSAARKPDLVATFRDWHLYTAGGGANHSCYLLSEPKEKTPKTLKRGEVSFLVSDWPARKVRHEPSVVPGYAYKEMSTVEVQAGQTKFPFFTQNERSTGSAWALKEDDEPKLVEAMKREAEMSVTGIDARGTMTRDNYSLSGFSAALAKMDQICR